MHFQLVKCGAAIGKGTRDRCIFTTHAHQVSVLDDYGRPRDHCDDNLHCYPYRLRVFVLRNSRCNVFCTITGARAKLRLLSYPPFASETHNAADCLEPSRSQRYQNTPPNMLHSAPPSCGENVRSNHQARNPWPVLCACSTTVDGCHLPSVCAGEQETSETQPYAELLNCSHVNPTLQRNAVIDKGEASSQGRTTPVVAHTWVIVPEYVVHVAFN